MSDNKSLNPTVTKSSSNPNSILIPQTSNSDTSKKLLSPTTSNNDTSRNFLSPSTSNNDISKNLSPSTSSNDPTNTVPGPSTSTSDISKNSLIPSTKDQPTNIQLKSAFPSPKETNSIELCFKGENLQQLSTNSLPPYVPSSPPNIVKADMTGYEYHCCTDCGDTFALKSSLTFHLERRSVLIKFSCKTCKSVQIFYNRCTLLSHIRSHTDKSETADITRAVVYPLPRMFMDGLQTDISNSLDEELSSVEESDATRATDLLEFSLKEVDNSVGNTSPEKPMYEETKTIPKVKCLDCNEEFNTVEERAKHLTANDKVPVIATNQCNKCSMICPSKCFLKAHQRIHLQVSPYVCPECGESPSRVWQNFQVHVKFKCFHNSRSVGYKCPVCKRLSPTNFSLLKHMELHSEKYLKCDSCASAYMNVATFNSHIDVHHRNYSIKPKYSMIYKCALCDIVFVNNEQMVSHRSTHLKDQISEYVFNCMQCGKPLENKSQLSDHIKSSHPKIFRTIKENFQLNVNLPEPKVVTYRGKVECILCNLTFLSHTGYNVHLTKVHNNYNQPCTYCYMVLSNRKELVNHGKKHLNKGCFLCLLCNNKKWNDEKQLNDHLIKHVSRLQFCSFCPICNEIMVTPPEAIAHLRQEHMLFEELGTHTAVKTSDTVKEIVTCHFCRDSFVNESELQDHLETRHHVDNLKRSNGPSDEDNPNKSAGKKPRLDGNVCAKCNYHAVEREDFKKHILSHKTNKCTLQCQECGLCFVVEPALVKHLRVVHKINDPKKYIEEEGTNFMPDFENQTAVSSCNSLLCSVCFTTFPSEASLKTHLRSHGMAFIQAAKSNIVS